MTPIERICASSYRDFHAKGFDYLCLHRSPAVTLKAYFFENEALENPEIVMPHDHRYGFTTTVLAGSLAERRWREPRSSDPYWMTAEVFQEFSYRTPLNGGDGFTWERETSLISCAGTGYHSGQTYLTPRDQIHTLACVKPGTVIVLTQFADELPIDAPTRGFRRDGRESPSLDGLYQAITPDHALMRVNQLMELGWPASPLI